MLFIDLDRFKTINDTLGHRVGDLLLQAVAKRLREWISPDYMLARLGGDEFAIIVPKVESLATVEALAKAARSRPMAAPFSIDGYQMPAAMSIGIAIGPQDGAIGRRTAGGGRSRALCGEGGRPRQLQILPTSR